MAGRLVTIATFEQLAEAHATKSALENAGLPTALDNEQTASVFGQVPSIAGIRLLVREEDESRAAKVLDEMFEHEAVDEQELAALTEAAHAEDAVEAGQQPPPAVAPGADSAARERDARIALQAACLGWVTAGIGHLFAIVMIMNAASGPGTLSRRGWRHVYAAGLIAFAPWVIALPIIVVVLLLWGRL